MITALHHFSTISSSELSISFYEKLGFRVSFKKDRVKDTVVVMNGRGIQLEVFIDPSHPKRACDPENLGLRGLSFKVDDFEDAKTQFECGPVMIDWFGQKYCITHDPDGLPIQFYE